jgi:hypothetical protein
MNEGYRIQIEGSHRYRGEESRTQASLSFSASRQMTLDAFAPPSLALQINGMYT